MYPPDFPEPPMFKIVERVDTSQQEFVVWVERHAIRLEVVIDQTRSWNSQSSWINALTHFSAQSYGTPDFLLDLK